MRRSRPAAVLSTAGTAALLLAGCANGEPAQPPPEPPPSAAVAPTPDAALPAPELLAGLLYQLADTAVPGAEKLGLVEGAQPDDAGKLDSFAKALRDGGYLPLTFDVTNVAWSDRNPANAVADVEVTTRHPETGNFALPMEFKQHGGGWQLSGPTAQLLLALGSSRPGTSAPTTPTR